MSHETVVLSSQDIVVRTEVLDRTPSLHAGAYAVKAIEQRLSYPVADLESLIRGFSELDDLAIRDVRVTPDASFGESRFSIHTLRQLISHLIMAFERERMSHEG